MSFIVYEHIFPNGKKYVGITCQRPNRRWRNGKAYNQNIRMSNAIKKFGWNNIEHLILAENLTQEEAEAIEIGLIADHNLMDPECGYNNAPGGTHPRHSAEIRRKIGLKSIGRTHSEEFKQQMRELNSGKNNYMYGKHHSEITRQKISEARRKQHLPGANKGKFGSDHPSSRKIACIDISTNQTVKEFGSVNEAQKEIRVSMSCLQAALHGHQKTCAGFRWVYI